MNREERNKAAQNFENKVDFKSGSKVNVIGAGLAGCDAAHFLASCGIRVKLFEMKPKKFSPAHSDKNFGELVCSNSLKSNDVYGNACGLLKEEMRKLGSLVIEAADHTSVPAGGALAVDRSAFSEYITRKICSDPMIEVIEEEVKEIPGGYSIIATGPLTSDAFSKTLVSKFGENLYFYDAAAPIVSAQSVDFSKAFVADRYGKGNGDYLNCPLTKEEYEAFVDALVTAERGLVHEFDKREVFEGCMPVEVMAARGKDTLRNGMLKPVGLNDAEGKRPYAVLQLRKENVEGSAYNLVGCQTNLKFSEQKRVFSLIPALKNAEFVRYGVMHRNTFLNSPHILKSDFSLKEDGKVFFAGQMTGVEGYVESAASGLYAAICCALKLAGKDSLSPDPRTVCGALARHVSCPSENFQPMNANYALLSPFDEQIRDKALKKKMYAERSLEITDGIAKMLKGIYPSLCE